MANPRRVRRFPGSVTGRPPLILQDKVRDRLLSAIRVGNWEVVACRYAGVSIPALHSWKGEGRDARIKVEDGLDLTDREQFFLDFVKDLEEAEAVAEVSIVGNLMRQTASSPQAALGMLAVRFPDRWRERKALEISGPEGGPISLSPVLAEISDETLDERIRALEVEVQRPKPKPRVLKSG